MTVYEFRRIYLEKHPDSHFFDRKTLKFFGERMSDMHLRKDVTVTDYLGNKHKCYVLSKYQRNASISPRYSIHYFDMETLDEVFN